MGYEGQGLHGHGGGGRMGDAAGEGGGVGVRVTVDRRLKLGVHGARVSSDAGLLIFRELDDALGLTALAADLLHDARTGETGATRSSLISAKSCSAGSPARAASRRARWPRRGTSRRRPICPGD